MKNIHVFTADVDRTLRGKNNPGPLTLSAFEKRYSNFLRSTSDWYAFEKTTCITFLKDMLLYCALKCYHIIRKYYAVYVIKSPSKDNLPANSTPLSHKFAKAYELQAPYFRKAHQLFILSINRSVYSLS